MSWVDEDVVKFADPSLFQGFSWWPGLLAQIGLVLCVGAAIGGLLTIRKKQFALAGLLTATLSLVFLLLAPFAIRGEIVDMIAAGTLPATTQTAMFFGYHFAFIGIVLVVVGFVWTLGAQPILGPEDRLLRVAVLWQGKMIKETTFTEKRDITIGEGATSDFVVPGAFDGAKAYPLFKVDPKGNYSVALTREMKGRVHLDGVVSPIDEFVKKHTGDHSGANYQAITKGDWGVLEFGKVELFFQFVRPDFIVGRKRAMAADGILISTALTVFFVVLSGFTTAQFLWDPFGSIEQRSSEKRLMKVEMNIVQEKDEVLLDIGEEDDSVGKKAEGEEGKFGDPDKDPDLESKVPRRDGALTNKIDPKKIGLADMLSNKLAKSGAISAILSDNADSFDNRMAVAMAGTGSELTVGYGAGGMGFKGTGPGGGGTGGYGRIHGLGRVDTGGGMGMRAGLGTKKAKSVGKIALGGMQGTGFCKRDNIQSVVMQRAGAIRACYEAQLQIHEGLAGKVSVRWTINMEGSVEGASMTESTIGNSAVEQCVLRAIRHMRFAKPEGGICVVAWPFVFNPG